MIAEISGPGHDLSQYEIPDRELPAGSTLGAPKGTMVIKPTGAMQKLYSAEAGRNVFGTLVLHHWDPNSGTPLVASPGEFIIHAYHQEHVFVLSDDVAVHEDLFMLNGKPDGEDLHEVDPPAAYYCVELENRSDETIEIATYASLNLGGGLDRKLHASYDKEANAFMAYDEDDRNVVRIASCSERPRSYECSLDIAKTSAAHFPGDLSSTTMASCNDPIAIFHLQHRLKPKQKAAFYFVLTFSVDGKSAARKNAASLPVPAEALARTREHYHAVLSRATLVTPDREVNRGVLWAKANMLRCQSLTSQGWCFVNDPTRSSHSVARDTAWFAFGCDYVMPHFSRDSVMWYLDHLEPKGMAVEYFDIRNGKTEDDDVNVNDNTPLVILAAWHYYAITGDREFLEHAYPKAERAAQYILSQRNDAGLVWCTADGTAGRGIIGWRNIIQGYRLSGATTEVNSECYAAVATLGKMAREIGKTNAARRFEDEAAALRTAINTHLLDRSRNLYYLNIDLDGTPRTDVTCDLVFPVMFGVAERDVAANIIARLSTPEFWSEAGLHTVPRTSIRYEPALASGLFGGVWAGPTFWYAFAAAGFNAEFMAHALSAGFRHYSQDPRRNNTVPGQFSEWLHGETLTNQGMMLSPWFAPKYVWAAIEGAAGLDISAIPPSLNPRPPSSWDWIGVSNVILRGRPVTWFAVRIDDLRVYANYPFASIDREQQFDGDVSEAVHVTGESAVCLALHRPDRTVVFVGNTGERTITTTLRIRDAIANGRFRLRSYSTLRREWVEERDFDGSRLKRGLAVQINRRGFCLMELLREDA